MSRLPTCPRCGAYVQTDWQSCKICGYHPDDPLTHGPLVTAEPPKRRFDLLGLLYGVIVLVVLVALSIGAVRVALYTWQRRSAPAERQEYIVIPKG